MRHDDRIALRAHAPALVCARCGADTPLELLDPIDAARCVCCDAPLRAATGDPAPIFTLLDGLGCGDTAGIGAALADFVVWREEALPEDVFVIGREQVRRHLQNGAERRLRSVRIEGDALIAEIVERRVSPPVQRTLTWRIDVADGRIVDCAVAERPDDSRQ